MRTLKVLLTFVLLSLTAQALARQTVTSGAMVDMLQRMQGKWKTECAVIGDTSRQQHLSVTFTHMVVSRQEFSDTECRLERQRLQRRYRFTLTDTVITTGGERAYALNLAEDGADEGRESGWFNLIRVDAGKLLLGDPEFSPTQTRPNRLDHSTVFAR